MDRISWIHDARERDDHVLRAELHDDLCERHAASARDARVLGNGGERRLWRGVRLDWRVAVRQNWSQTCHARVLVLADLVGGSRLLCDVASAIGRDLARRNGAAVGL